MRYFAYGSNMDPDQMARRCPGGRSLGKALLRGYRLVFTWDSARWQGGVGHVIEDPDDAVWGVLWDLDDEHVASLDVYEGIADGIYRQGTVTVEHDGAMVEALIYFSNDDRELRPSRRYVRALMRGAVAHGFPDDYVERIRASRDPASTRSGGAP